MKLIEISKTKFKNFADKSPYITFHQTKEWAALKSTNGWHDYYVALEEDGNILGAALILSKNIPLINHKIFYSPRGFLIDYNNFTLVEMFTKEIKKFAKDKKAIFIKIDPYVSYKQRDNDGNIVQGGTDNSKIIDNLKNLGYKHFGFNLMQETLQPRWMHVIDTKDKNLDDVLKDMESKTRQILRKNERCGIKIREIERDELPLFKEIMQKTSDRRAFVDRPLTYYENMWDTLHKDGILKILVASIDFDLYLENTIKQKDEIAKEMQDRLYKKENNILKMNEKRFQQKQKFDEDEIKRLDKEIEKIKKYQDDYGHFVYLGSVLFLIYGNEVLSLYGGSIEKFMNFQSAYSLHYEMIKYAVENKYKRYNFYGITGIFNKDNPLYGLYLFKKSFGGVVVELIGEFDLIVNKPLYYLYKFSYKIYHKIKSKS